MSTTTHNRLESRLGGVTVEGEPHSLSAWFVLGLRLMMGWVFLTAGIGKLTGFSAQGYLANVDPASPASGLYATMAATPELMAIIDVAIPVGQVMIGLGLLIGAFVRLAALGGALMMAAFYFGNWSVSNGFVNADFVYLVVLAAIGAFAAGRILGFDTLIENYRVDGERLVDRYPKARYLLG